MDIMDVTSYVQCHDIVHKLTMSMTCKLINKLNSYSASYKLINRIIKTNRTRSTGTVHPILLKLALQVAVGI